MGGYYILNALGEPEPTDMLTWARWFENAKARQIASTEIGNVQVSTVFLGSDHNFSRSGRPILWETLVFGGSLDGEMYRYESRLQAMQGHEEMVGRVRAAQPTRQIEMED